MTKEKQFQQIYSLFFNKVYNFIFSRTNSQDDAEDIVQDTFIGIWKSMDKLDVSRNLGAWVFQIARNKLNDYLKSKYKVLERTTSQPTDNISEENLDDYTDDNREYLSKAHKEAMKMIEKLDDNYRKVLELRYIKGYKIKEVAQELKLTENNVKVIQNRAIKKLKELINL